MFKTIKISNQSTDKEIENATYWANYVTLKTGVPVVIELVDPSDPDVMEPKFNKDDVAKKPKKKGLQDKSLEDLAEEVDSMVERLLMFEREEIEDEVDIKGVVLNGLSLEMLYGRSKEGEQHTETSGHLKEVTLCISQLK